MAAIHLTGEEFKQQVFNWDVNKEWKYEGSLPAIVDFMPTGAVPCKMVAPILERSFRGIRGKLLIYKVNTDVEQEVSYVFGIQSIPTLLFIDAQGKGQYAAPRHCPNMY